jgi:hypothetical protein
MSQTVRDPSRASYVGALAIAGPRNTFCAAAGLKCSGWD